MPHCKIIKFVSHQYFQINLAVFNVNLGGVFNFGAYTFVRRFNRGGGRQDKGTERAGKEPGSNSMSSASTASTKFN